MINRRNLLYSLTCFSAANMTAPRLFSLAPDGLASAELRDGQRASTQARRSPYPHKPLLVGLVGVAGAGVYWQYEIARQLEYPHKMIAIETTANNARIRWHHPEDSSLLLIGGLGESPATITEAYRMGLSRRLDIAESISGLDVAFLVTGLSGIAGKGLASVVAETLRDSGVFTVAIVPGRREAKAIHSLGKLVNIAVEIPYPWETTAGHREPLWREQFASTIARKCREIACSVV